MTDVRTAPKAIATTTAATSERELAPFSSSTSHVSSELTVKMPLVDDGFEALLEPFYNGKKLTDPISTKEDKFQLLPAFLKVKGAFPFNGSSRSFPSIFTSANKPWLLGLVKQLVAAHRAINSDEFNPLTIFIDISIRITSSWSRKSRKLCAPTAESEAMSIATSGSSMAPQ